MADQHFISELERLQALARAGAEGCGQKLAQAAQRDPRIMQVRLCILL